MTTNSKAYVHMDDRGALRVGKTKVSLDSIVYAFRQGHSPETICEQFSSLSLEEIYGAIAFYLANRDEVHQYLERQQKIWDEFRIKSQQAPNPVVERLRTLRASRALKDQ
jgi:uncharacterized protein (DUF433 family)